MNFGFHAEAEKEYVDAIRHYLAIDVRLAEAFILEVEHSISAIRRNPLAWRMVEADVRRYLVIGSLTASIIHAKVISSASGRFCT